MAGLGLTIRMGASGTHVISPQGTVDITNMGRQQRGAFAEEISRVLGLEQELQPRGRRGRQEFRRRVSRADAEHRERSR